MRKGSLPATADAAPAAVQPHVIQPTAVYSVKQLQQALGLRASTVRREHRLGRLRIAKRAGKYFLLGAWIHDWLEAGEIRRDRPATPSSSGDDHHANDHRQEA